MGFAGQLLALLEKDVWIRKVKRCWIATLMEFVLPYAIIFATRSTIDSYSGPDWPTDGKWIPGSRFEPLGPFKEPPNVDAYAKLYYLPSSNYSKTMVLGAFKIPENKLVPLSTHAEFQGISQRFRGTEGFAIYFPTSPSGRTLQYSLRFPLTNDSSLLGETTLIASIMMNLFNKHVEYFGRRSPNDLPRLVLQPFPIGPTYQPPKLTLKQTMASMFAGHVGIIGFMWTFVSFCKFIMKEKENRFRELLRMMGMSDAVYWVNLVCVALSTAVPLCIICSVELTKSSKGTQFFKYTNPTIVFTTFLLFAIGNILMILLVAAICYTERAAATAVTVYLFGAQFLFEKIFDAEQDTWKSSKIFSSILPVHAFLWCVKVMYQHEAHQTGANWSNLFTPPLGSNTSLGTLYFVQLVSWLFWAGLVLYIDAVNPWQHGIPQKPLFCIEYFPWRSKPADVGETSISDGKESDMIEKIPADAGSPVVRVVRVSHSFGEVKAIDNLSLELYGHQITVLLGHNGAGKTTIMNIMTGLFAPDKGDILINNRSVTKETKKARESLGLCPQHNVLFEYLTVSEHLRFFAKLKGSKSALIAEEIDQILGKVDLLPKRDVLSVNLSGGMKRKLSLANAAIGGSKILILDEPSSGLDPEARRLIWEFLQEERKKRTILMTTHHMEEADVLGDRIILLARGRLMSAGSPMFLKKVFETGYKIRLAKKTPEVDTQSIVSAIEGALSDSPSTKVFVASELAFEVVVNIGFPSTGKMIALFKKLESEKDNLGVTNMGASVTTMEDVFIKVGDVDEAAARTEAETAANEKVIAKLPQFKPLEGPARLCRQFKGLMLKRVHTLKREWASSVHLLVWPLIFIYAFAVGMEKLAGDGKISKYSLKSLFGTTRGFVAGELNSFMARVRELFVEDGVKFDASLGESEDGINDYLLKLHNESELEYRRWSVGLTNRKLWFNGQARHLGGAALARWQSHGLSQMMGKDSNVDINNWPFTVRKLGRLEIDILIARMTASIMMPTVFAYMACPAISYPVAERVTKSKLIQLMTGVNPVLFHAANFCFDIMYQTLFATILLGFLRYQNPGGCFAYTSETLYALIALFLNYNIAMIWLCYLLAMFCSDPVTAMTTFTTFNTIPPSIAAAILALGETLRGFFQEGVLDNIPFFIQIASLHPTFSAVWGTTSVILNALSEKLCKFPSQKAHNLQCLVTYLPSCCQPCKNDSSLFCYEYQSSFSMDPVSGVGYQLSILSSMGFICMVLVLLSECNWKYVNCAIESLKKITRRSVIDPQAATGSTISAVGDGARDSDVVEEERAVESIVEERRMALHTLVASRLTKYFGNLQAVRNISFHLTGNECFGLLGTNGAGKTTTFGMLTGDIQPSEGDAFIKDCSMSDTLHEYRRQIGYCPQFDALQATLTGREVLELFCALRAIPYRESKAVIQSLIKLVDIVPHVDKRTGAYSGGSKRKLSLAVALVGNPTILLLDEPTAGVDPTARRRIYAALAQSQKDFNTAIVLTSHSIEVCEALCRRVAIMVGGSFRCLGPTQHLKSKYGTGFTVQIKLKEVSENTGANLAQAMSDIFAGKCELKQSYMRLFQFHVNDLSLKWSELFERIQRLRDQDAFLLEDIQVSDTTLEELFLAFGKSQQEPPPVLPSST